MPVPNVQWKTPDDEQRNCPNHVEFLEKINWEISGSVGFIIKKFVTMHGSHERKNKPTSLSSDLTFASSVRLSKIPQQMHMALMQLR